MAVSVVKNEDKTTTTTTATRTSTFTDVPLKNENETGEISSLSSTSSASSSCSSASESEHLNLLEFEAKNKDLTQWSGDSSASKPGSNKLVLSQTLKVLLLAALSIQGATYLLLARYTRSVPPSGGVMYDIHDLVLMSEVTKLIVCSIAEGWSTGDLALSLRKNVWNRPFDALKAAVPALIYVIQNSLTYVALSNLSAPLYVAMIQGKVFVTACVSVLLLQRVYKLRQWTCLVTLTFGLVVILMDQELSTRRDADDLELEDNSLLEEQLLEEDDLLVAETVEPYVEGGNFWVGAMAVLAACFCSAFASVYMEKVMKKDDGTSLYMRNIQLSFFGIVVASTQSAAAYHKLNREALLSSGLDEDGEYAAVEPVSFLHGFTTAVWLTCFLQAGGGLLIATIMKYLDSVMKGLAIAVSVVLITVVSWLFVDGDDNIVSPSFVSGSTIILVSVYFFSNPMPNAVVTQCGCQHGPSV